MKPVLSAAGLLLLAGLSLTACSKKDDPVNPPPAAIGGTGTVALRFAARAGAQPLVLNTGTYALPSGAQVQFSTFKYFATNLRLTGASGTANYAEPESYHLISAGDANGQTSFSLTGVPAGTYTGLTLLLGVDSARNVSGAQTGDLDPAGRAQGMFWTWNTGYIMAKVEGSSPQSGDSINHALTYHIGGFQGANSALRTVTLAFPQPLVVQKDGAVAAFLSADVLKWFGAPNPIDVRTLYFTMSVNPASKGIADNYATMLAVDSVRN